MNLQTIDFKSDSLRNICFTCIISLALCSLFSDTAISQSELPLIHKREYIAKGENYIEKFNYIINGKDTVPNGAYQLSKISNIDTTLNVLSIKIDGHQKNGHFHDFFKIRVGQYSPDVVLNLDEFNLNYSAKGEEKTAHGLYESGKKVGLWHIYQFSIKNAQVEDTLFAAQVGYNSNVWDNKISLNKNGQVLKAQINPFNYLDGEWHQKKSKSQYEYGVFESGFLTQLEVNSTEGKQSYDFTQHLNSVNYSFETHNFDKKYLDLLQYILTQNYAKLALDKLNFFNNNILLEYPTILEPINPILGLINDNGFPSQFLVKIPVVTLSKKDSIDIKNLSQQIEKTKSALDEIKKNIQIKALSEKIIKLNEYNIIIDRITELFFNPIDKIVDDFNQDVLKYFFTPKYLNDVYRVKDTIQYDFLEIVKTYTLQNKLSRESTINIDTLTNVMKAIEKEYQTIKQLMFTTIESLERQESLLALEAVLIQDYESIMQRLNDTTTDQVNEMAGFYVYNEIKSFLETRMTKYLSWTDEDKKLTEIPILLECIEDVGFLLNRLDELPLDVQTIDQLYINVVFNPYTFTNMEERINPGIYDAFQYTLLPSLLGKLKSLECENISFHRSEYDILFQGMVDLLKTNNKKVERYVKRTRDPQKIVNLLGIKIAY